MAIRRIEQDRRLSEAVVHGGLVYLAGQVGEPGEDVRAQMRTITASIERLLALAGSSKSAMLSATIWLADMTDFAAMNEIWDAWIDGQHPPARATGQVQLASPDYRVEVMIIAAQLP